MGKNKKHATVHYLPVSPGAVRDRGASSIDHAVMEKVFNTAKATCLTGETRMGNVDGKRCAAWIIETERWQSIVPTVCALGKVPDHHMAAAMAFYRGEASYAKILGLPLMESAMKLRKRNEWARLWKGGPWTDRLSTLAIQEYLDPGIAKLNGWWLYDSPNGPIWSAWSGDGYFIEGWWSRAISCTKGEWDNVMSPRYESVRAILDSWRHSCVRGMSRALQDYGFEFGVKEPDEDIKEKRGYKTTTRFRAEGLRVPEKIDHE